MGQKLTLRLAAASGFLAVTLGAFGAHALKPHLLEAGTLATWETAAQYHLIHSVAMLLPWSQKNKARPAWAFLVGIIIFSGSLYLLSTTGIKWLGAITPLGGLAFLTGWLLIFLKAGDENHDHA